MKNKKIKICHIASTDITVNFLLLSQLNFLVKEGYDVYVVCSNGKWINEIKKESIKVKIIKITRKISPFYDLVSLWNLFWYFKKEKFDIVHTHTPKPALLGQMAAKIAGVPIIINTVHGLYFGNKFSYFKKKFYIFIEKISDSFSDLVFSQNNEDMTMMEKYKIALGKTKYLGNGIDIDRFDKKKFSKEFIENKKKEFGINKDAGVVGIVGRLVREKGYFELFSAFKSVLQKYPNTILLVIGDKDLEKKDAFNFDVVNEFGIEKNVIFLGQRADVDEIYPLMDIFVLPSHREGFPRTAIEATAEKIPIVATDIRGCRDVVENQKNGILVPLMDINRLTEAIKFLLEDKNFAKSLGKNGRKRAEKEFDEKLVFEKIREEYLRLLKEKNII